MTFVAEGISRTRTDLGKSRFEVSFADGGGRQQTISLNAETALSLARALEDFTELQGPSVLTATKLPAAFAVGSARYEPLVLVRFEDDAPYGLQLPQAAELGRALIDLAEADTDYPNLRC